MANKLWDFFIRREIMVKYECDFDTMIKNIRKTWSPEDFLQATKNLMIAPQEKDQIQGDTNGFWKCN